MKRLLQLSLIAILLMTCVPVLATAAPLAALETKASPPDKPAVYDEMPPPQRRDPSQPNHYGNSPWAPPDKDDSNFPQDRGQYLDRYLYRRDVPNGRLTFDIEIDRYYTSLITRASLDANGFLRSSVLTELIEKNLLPETATLALAVYDVDHDASPCPEVDHVYINGNQIQDPSGSGPFKLTSGNNRWDIPRVPFPIGFLRFPTEQGTNGRGPTPAVNQIAVDIDVQCGTLWAVEVDWGSIFIESPIRPVVFAHGWTGNQNVFDAFQGWLWEDGIPVQEYQTDLRDGIHPIPDTSPWLVTAVTSTTLAFGVDKVNIFAHSKGGLVSRHALRNEDVRAQVDHLITFSSPHHGTDLIIPMAAKCPLIYRNEPTKIGPCLTAAAEVTVGRIRNDGFNYTNCTKGPWPWSDWTGCQPNYPEYTDQPTVTFRTLVGGLIDIPTSPPIPVDIDAKTATYPWKADEKPFPRNADVDAQFVWDHSRIKQTIGPYRCAISYIDSSIYSSLWCLSPVREPDELANEESPVWPGNEFQSVMEVQDSMAAGMSQTISALVDGGTYAIFNVLSDVPLTFTLIDPNGRVIDPTVAAGDPAIAYFAQLDPESGLFWWYQYVVSNPMAGEWQNVLDAADPVEFSAFTMVDSAVQLHYKTDRYTYAPGEVVTVEAALASTNVPILGAQMSGTVQNSDGSQLSMPLYDDGTHGDVTPGDGVYTGQFITAGATGHASIELSGTEGLVSRTVTTNVAVTAQTAEFQAITAETPVDTNANGLYDMLNLSAQLNVITGGHFEISATLVDSNDERIASGFFSTRLSGLDPLAAGLQTIILSFDGNTIRQHGVDGPYQLTNLIIRDVSDGSFEVDTANNVYTTAAYQANQFEAPLISLAGGSEEVIDTNANGLYDQLSILVNVNVVRTGTYNWSGRLVDQRGAEIGWTQGAGTLNNQTPMAFTFAGQLIGAHGQDGPYVLRDVSIYQTSGGNATALFEEAYVTEPYSYLDFEGGTAAALICNDTPEGFDAGPRAAGWTVLTGVPGGPEWTDLSACGPYPNWTNGAGNAACVSAGNIIVQPFDSELRTPVFSLAGYVEAYLNYQANYQNWASQDQLDLDISSDGGVTWTTLRSWQEDHGAPFGLPGENVNVNLASYLGQSNLMARWRYYTPSGQGLSYYAQLDEVRLNCTEIPPTAVTVMEMASVTSQLPIPAASLPLAGLPAAAGLAFFVVTWFRRKR